VVVTVVALGAGYALWRLPATRRFVGTVREAAARRETELRAAVETAVRADATSRAPRHAPGATVPDLEVEAGWDPDRRRRGTVPLGAADPGRSLSPEEARALLLDRALQPRAGAGRRRASSRGALTAPARPSRPVHPCGARHSMSPTRARRPEDRNPYGDR
jgi:hypothetical protein